MAIELVGADIGRLPGAGLGIQIGGVKEVKPGAIPVLALRPAGIDPRERQRRGPRLVLNDRHHDAPAQERSEACEQCCFEKLVSLSAAAQHSAVRQVSSE
jgi:hypothetical protein